jgi:hypothetical protein
MLAGILNNTGTTQKKALSVCLRNNKYQAKIQTTKMNATTQKGNVDNSKKLSFERWQLVSIFRE